MDVARHGIFDPRFFSFESVMCIYLAVVISDVFLLDLFNSLGLPTSTTVSMVFELLGASFVTALISSGGEGLSHLNTDRALTIIISIFLSVAIAFVFGLIVQWISRLVFTSTTASILVARLVSMAVSLQQQLYISCSSRVSRVVP